MTDVYIQAGLFIHFLLKGSSTKVTIKYVIFFNFDVTLSKCLKCLNHELLSSTLKTEILLPCNTL